MNEKKLAILNRKVLQINILQIHHSLFIIHHYHDRYLY